MRRLVLGLAAALLAGGTAQAEGPPAGLKVEQSVESGEAVKGRTLQFKISLANTSRDVVRDVTVRVKLSEGLRHEVGDHIELVLPRLGPGQRIVLDPLRVEVVGSGEQSCAVTASGPGFDEARDVKKVAVK